MTAEEALTFIHSVKWQGSKPGLERIRELLDRLGSPQRRLKFIHVAGTNGKGSTSAMLASILKNAGYKTGLYTSPYIHRFNERMTINGSQISDEELVAITERIRPLAESMEDRPTEFEIVTAVGMEYFAQNSCDYVVLEVGMGGRLDATNAIELPELAVITRIGLDHTAELGDTAEKIAFEKAGIIKHGGEVVLYQQDSSVMDVFSQVCAERNSRLNIADFSRIERLDNSRKGQTFKYKDGESVFLPLLGKHQLANAAVVMESVIALRRRGLKISYEAVKSGLEEVKWPARFEIVSQNPWFVIDGGHNPQCAETVRDNLEEYFPDMHRVLLVGVMADKDYGSLSEVLSPVADEFVAVRPDTPRALDAEILAESLRRFGKPVTVCPNIEAGVETAKKLAGNGVACAVGSLYMSGPVRECFGLF